MIWVRSIPILIYQYYYQEPWSEAHQERLELLRARVLELNRQLGALAAGWRHGQLSLHMNLALPTMALTTTTATPNNAAVLRSQNRMLAEVCVRHFFFNGNTFLFISKSKCIILIFKFPYFIHNQSGFCSEILMYRYVSPMKTKQSVTT